MAPAVDRFQPDPIQTFNLEKVVSGPRVVKVQSSVKKRCIRCKIVRRRGIVRVICSANPRHKQRQGPIRGSSSRFKGKRSKGKG